MRGVRGDVGLIGRDEELAAILAGVTADPPVGVVLVGPAGVGKTRLAREAIARVAESGIPTLWIPATPSAEHLPFGALTSVAGGDHATPASDPGAARRAILERAGSGRLVVAIDDAHWLDEPSAAVLWQLVTDTRIVVLATARQGEPVPHEVLALWKEGAAERIDVEPLGDDEVGALCRRLLGADVDPVLLRAIVKSARGIPLLLRELVVGARGDGSIERGRNGWRLVRDLDVPRRVIDLVGARLAGLDEQSRDALELVALGEPLPLPWLIDSVGDECVDALQADGLLDVRGDVAAAPAVWLGHPLVGDALRTEQGPARRRRHLERLAAHIDPSSAVPADRIRLVRWRLETGSPVEPDLIAAAVHDLVRAGDYPGAAQLADALWDLAPGGASGHLLGHVLARLGEGPRAESVLAAAAGLATSDEERALVVIARSENLVVNLEQFAEAMDVCRRAELSITDSSWRAEVEAQRAEFSLYAGDVTTTLAITVPMLASAEDRVYVAAAAPASMALSHDGRPLSALEVSTRAYRLHLELWSGGFLPNDPGFHLLRQGHALLHAGRLEQATTLADELFAGVVEQGHRAGLPLVAFLRAATAMERGRLATACEWFSRAADYFTRAGWESSRRWALAGLVRVAAQLGRVDDARAAAEGFAPPDPPRGADVIGITGLAWLAWRESRVADAAHKLEDAVELALSTSNRTNAVLALHDLAVLGWADRAVETARRLVPEMEGPLLPAKLETVLAAADGDAAGLADAGARLADLGADLAAAEAFGSAATLARQAGDSKQADRLRAQATEHLTPCEGAGAESLTPHEEVDQLTPRERQVALLAAARLPSKRIAAELNVTRRTVDNLLARAYRKLGVSSRSDLEMLLGPQEATSTDA